jgi:hypothetical protein
MMQTGMATLNKAIQSKDAQIIEMEQKLEDANRYGNTEPDQFRAYPLGYRIHTAL